MRQKGIPMPNIPDGETAAEEIPMETTAAAKDYKFECATCGRKFPRKDTLKRHEIKHSGEKTPYFCEICKKYFRGKWELSRHDAVHQQKVYHCDICTVEFPSKRALVSHNVSIHGASREVNENSARYPCHLCKRRFSNKYGYEGHLRKHKKDDVKIDVDVGDISCQKCGKMFTYQQSLTRHDKICCSKNHQKQFICSHVPCGRSYTDMKGLAVHVRTVHERIFYTCHCGKSYSYTSGLWKHKKTCNIPSEENIAESPVPTMADERIKVEPTAYPKLENAYEGVSTIHEIKQDDDGN